ncbi:Hypothetical protein SRAE_0000012200 [Strongyloides ratti]|uniref:Uncharacterized protein n=1 Tax=Strongyloides ratti TaxID=34506 RepID=A0A090KTZ1_STRRB|nr:Hypothetical protein SRAE_0000012200 [Strongyloides ratti]CEF60990.1 Hypothetical protein SRAE_0000012200 [Strongyloides ratti]
MPLKSNHFPSSHKEESNELLKSKDNYFFNEDLIIYRKKEKSSEKSKKECKDDCGQSTNESELTFSTNGDEFKDYETTVPEYISGRKTHRD